MTTTDLQHFFEHAGVTVGAITGVLAARKKEIDLIGVLILALAAAFGGGTVRDLLVGDTPVAWLRGPYLMFNAIISALATFFLARYLCMPQGLLQVADAVSLAFFTMLGVGKGLAFEMSSPVCVLLGVVTGIVGGILRDVLLDEVPSVLRRGIHLYATAAIAGGIVNLLVQPAGSLPAAAAGFFVVLGIRLAAMKWKLSLPVFEMKE
ncbi:MAG TPA: trimeric intracellular cation channel family protein [Verrucomicrobiales bacterium]|nr:trimeric intracellular cation channel family protein [Verrucomicrobiales bacterium]